MDDQLFNQLVAGLDSQPPATAASTQPQAQPSSYQPHVGVPAPGQGEGPILPPVGSPEAFNPSGGLPGANEPGLQDPTRTVLDAPVAGAANSVFQTKDFITGETPEADKSDFRKNAEATQPGDGLGYSLTRGVAQFATGLLGAGKLLAAARGVKALGSGLEAVEGLRGGTAAVEAAKAAAVGAIAFDPHSERLSNLIQSSPALSNPVNQFLAAKPDDSAATGRLKNALESLGMDAALVGVVGATVKSYKAFQGLKDGTGGFEEAVKSADEVGAAMDQHNALKDKVEGGADAQAEGAKPADAVPPSPDGEPDSAPPLTVTPKGEPAAADGAAPEAAPEPEPETHTDLSGREFTKDSPEQPWKANSKYGLELEDPEQTAALHAARGTTPKEGEVRYNITRDGQPVGLLEATAPPGSTKATVDNITSTETTKADAPGTFGPGAMSQLMRDFKAKHPDVETLEGVRTSGARQAGEQVDHTDGVPVSVPLGRQAPEVTRVQSPTAGAPEGGLPARPEGLPVYPEEARSIYEGAASDMEAFDRFGTWDNAVDNGHIFGKGGSIPYQKLVGAANGEKSGLDAFVTNVSEQLKTQFDAAKGGDILSDARVQNLVQQRYKLYGEDPAALMGLIQRAGADANSLVANMEASYGIAQRGYQDAYALAARIKAGDFTGFENFEGAIEGLRQRLDVAGSAWASGQSMRAASGRALRRMRSEFRPQQSDIDAIKSMDPDALVELLNTTGGDPRLIQKATQPGLLSTIKDTAQFLYTNNLLWGFRTHAINFSTNFYMVAARPMERILGSLAQQGYAALKGDASDLTQAAIQQRKEALQSYTYMASTLQDSWKSAVAAFQEGDSILAPHNPTELATGVGSHGDIGKQIAQMQWRPWDSLGNVTANALMVAAPKALGMPSRTIGMVDEFIKNISYRSNVMAKAQVEGVSNGLAGDALSQFVKNRLYDSFDDAGRAVDGAALQEAKIATFQQDLLPNTLGKGVQNLTTNVPFLKYILPFVRTPTNVIRYGWKMTPGLNALQGEYRDAIRGVMGPEQQAQAIGQMAMGSLFMGVAAMLHHTGAITGGGPSNPVQRAKLRATGWQPYSFVKTNEDGSLTYVPYGRFDPVAMPLGMVADVGDVWHQAMEDPNSKLYDHAGTMMMAVATSLAKSFSEKSYLKSVDDAIQFASDPDAKASKWAGGIAANFVPAASLLRFTNPDPNLRDARNFLDYSIQEIPGLSQTLPAKRDAFGDPITVHKGFWINSPGDIVDAELRRMGEKPDADGSILGPPPAKFKGGIDLRDITMTDGSNAYDKFQELARQPSPRSTPIKDVVAKLMQTDGYKNAPDGDAQTKGTKMAIITKPMARYREAATKEMMADKNVRDAAYKKQMATVSAYANRNGNQNPTPQNNQSNIMGKLTGAFSNMMGGGQTQQ